jgi:hypothetical protein
VSGCTSKPCAAARSDRRAGPNTTVTFLDSTGIAVLVIAHRRAVSSGHTLTVVNAQGGLRRVLDITGVLPTLTGPAAIRLDDHQPGSGTPDTPAT